MIIEKNRGDVFEDKYNKVKNNLSWQETKTTIYTIGAFIGGIITTGLILRYAGSSK